MNRTINAVVVGEGAGGGDVEVKVIFALPNVLNFSNSISLIGEFHLTGPSFVLYLCIVN